MVNLLSQSLTQVNQAGASSLYQDFTIELEPNLLLDILTSYQLKASEVTGDYNFNPQAFEQFIKSPPYNSGSSTLKNTSYIISSWPEKLSWSQFNHQINNLLLAWLNDYKLGANLDTAFLLARCLELKTDKHGQFQNLLMHLIARVTNQLEQYKFSYVQNFDLDTGLPNQHLLASLLKQYLKTESVAENDSEEDHLGMEHLGLILINLNINFDEESQLNSAASNLMLAAIATIQQHLNNDATLFYVGSIDLAILIKPLKSTTQLSLMATKLIHAFETALPLENITLILKPYIGAISTFNIQTNAISIYEYARLALHHAIIKNEQVKIYDQHISSSFMNAHLLDEAIIEALQQNELAVFLQPIVSIHHKAGTNEICISAEVLLRWPNQEWQALSPSRLIDVIYKKGFGKVFIRWLINNACQRCAELISAHQKNIALTINLSSIDLLDADLPELLAQSIALWQIPAENLIIEITENDILVDEIKVAKVIDKIKQLGCKLALDDFGTGYSSMARLRNMPIDIVKIDQSFVRNIATSDQDKEIVQSVVKLAHSLGKEVVAEGVENQACLDILKELKCEKIQGYFYGKPMSFDDFIAWLSVFESTRQR
ncbi:MAG: GGDEF domain-containing protein [Methylotenera sp.]|uniref:putative bifunctional diguanylate cyclase/phosphodiesterase n=1 Tax=Methylotenera sp. TaxID=2051956 RepID=UPI0017E79781|nr:GGDEF domain-containing phosphodiesterase [Methylotenera sp.]NOU25748.1 GGDEF domain-containing protein [Methylotenera sp.]